MKSLTRLLIAGTLTLSLSCAHKKDKTPFDIYEHLKPQYETIVGKTIEAGILPTLNYGIGVIVENNGEDTTFAYFSRKKSEDSLKISEALSLIKNSEKVELTGNYMDKEKKTFEIKSVVVNGKRIGF